MPAYLIPAVGYETAVRPLLICTNGYDAAITDIFFASAVAATARGYHCLIFDGPGQGEMLIEHGMTLRPDWETVIKAVVDFALTLSVVDPARIALSGWSLGGYLAPRAASGEHRLAACIADPGLWSVASGLRAFCEKLGVPAEAAANPADIEQPLLDKMWQAITGDRKLRWTIIQRGFWVNGVENLREFLRCITSKPSSSAVRRWSRMPKTIRWRPARRICSKLCGARRSSFGSARLRAPAAIAK